MEIGTFIEELREQIYSIFHHLDLSGLKLYFKLDKIKI